MTLLSLEQSAAADQAVFTCMALSTSASIRMTEVYHALTQHLSPTQDHSCPHCNQLSGRHCLYVACPAGVGSVLAASGQHELEASVMSSSGSACGAVALIKRVANPIVLARHVSWDV
jgi:hypothetical protein